MKPFQTSSLPVRQTDLKQALAWWSQFDAKKQTALQKKHDLLTYVDLIAFWKEAK